MYQRQRVWDSKKMIKMENLKQSNLEKEREQCFFKPHLVI